jgi:hypothetical protein
VYTVKIMFSDYFSFALYASWQKSSRKVGMATSTPDLQHTII